LSRVATNSRRSSIRNRGAKADEKPGAVRRLTLEHAELVPEREHICLEIETRPNGRPERDR
jgi:hypothetical protein